MQRLHGGNDIQLRQSGDILRMQQLDVFYPMAEMRQAVIVFKSAQVLVCVQHLVIGAVTYGVNRHPEPHIGGLPAHFEQLLRILVQHSLVVRLALERLEHGSRARAEGPVHEDLDGADPEPVVSKAGAEPEFVGGIQQFDRQMFLVTRSFKRPSRVQVAEAP